MTRAQALGAALAYLDQSFVSCGALPKVARTLAQLLLSPCSEACSSAMTRLIGLALDIGMAHFRESRLYLRSRRNHCLDSIYPCNSGSELEYSIQVRSILSVLTC